MMYRIEYNNLTIYDASNPALQILSGNADFELNKAGSLTITLPASHKYIARIERLKHVIKLYDNNDLIFQGRVLDFEFDFYNNKRIYCEGELSYFKDSIQDPFEFKGDIPVFLNNIITAHNKQVDEHKRFKLGIVTVTDPNNLIVRESKDYLDSLTMIRQKLVDMLGGYIVIRHEEDGTYIDYLKDIDKIGNQNVQFGLNLTDIKRTIAGADIATAILPLGAEDKDTDKRITIEEITGKKYITDEEAVNKYGLIVRTETWEDVTLPSNLIIKAKQRLAEWVKLGVNLEISAADLAPLDSRYKSYRVGDKIKIISPYHGINDIYLINSLHLNLLNPAENNLQIGSKTATLTEYQVNKEAKIDTVESIVNGTKSDVKKISTKTQSFAEKVKEVSDKISELEQNKDNLTDTQKAEIEKQLEQERKKLAEIIDNKDKIVKADLEAKLNDSFNIVKSEYERKIEETAGGIRDTLKESYYTKDESKALISEEGISKFTSKDEFEIAYNRFIQDISAIQSGTAAEFLKIKKYLHFGEDGVTIGEVGTAQSNICIKIDNDRISFLDNGAEVAYWKNRNFYAVDGEFLNSLKLGRFAFIPRKNGNLSFVKVVN